VALLEVQDVTVRFGGLAALDAVNVTVHPGEIVSIIGPNGAGKTTMFNVISGLQQPATGAVRFQERDITRAQPHVRARRGMGRTFQRVQLFGQLSVLDNVLLGAEGTGPSRMVGSLLRTPGVIRSERQARAKAREILQVVGIEEHGDRQARKLPLGLLRRVELARALASSPLLLLLDEPASGMDEHESRDFAELVHELRPLFGLSILVVEHDMKVVNRISDFIYVLDFGRVIASGVPAEVARNELVLSAYLGGEGSEDARVLSGR
jgi:ABC-type branched-subunit amino acid transport system ATPase component